MSQNLKTAIVTGASSGIGLEVSRALLARGMKVVMNGRNEQRLKEAAESLGRAKNLAIHAGDIGRLDTGNELVALALKEFGSVDILVNNAGTFAARPFVDVTESELDSYLNGNLKGTFLTTQAVVKQMIREGGGSIVNIGTVLVDHAAAGFPSSAPIVSKGGIHALTVSLAAELAQYGIRVNMVAPGVIKTPLHGNADVGGLRKLALLDRIGETEDISHAVLHLMEARFVTGHIMPVDGGFVTGRA